MRRQVMATLFITVAIVAAGCGAGSGDTDVAPAPKGTRPHRRPGR